MSGLETLFGLVDNNSAEQAAKAQTPPTVKEAPAPKDVNTVRTDLQTLAVVCAYTLNEARGEGSSGLADQASAFYKKAPKLDLAHTAATKPEIYKNIQNFNRRLVSSRAQEGLVKALKAGTITEDDLSSAFSQGDFSAIEQAVETYEGPALAHSSTLGFNYSINNDNGEFDAVRLMTDTKIVIDFSEARKGQIQVNFQDMVKNVGAAINPANPVSAGTAFYEENIKSDPQAQSKLYSGMGFYPDKYQDINIILGTRKTALHHALANGDMTQEELATLLVKGDKGALRDKIATLNSDFEADAHVYLEKIRGFKALVGIALNPDDEARGEKQFAKALKAVEGGNALFVENVMNDMKGFDALYNCISASASQNALTRALKAGHTDVNTLAQQAVNGEFEAIVNTVYSAPPQKGVAAPGLGAGPQ